jgi:hypothetical protein
LEENITKKLLEFCKKNTFFKISKPKKSKNKEKNFLFFTKCNISFCGLQTFRSVIVIGKRFKTGKSEFLDRAFCTMLSMKHLLASFVMTTAIFGAEPTLALLQGVSDDQRLYLSVGGKPMSCKPYGVILLEKLAISEGVDPSCRNVVSRLFKQQPTLKHFWRSHLKLFQQYRVEMRSGECTLYANSTQSYAELLIKAGVAMRKPLLNDELWIFRWKKAQRIARNQKHGIWRYDDWVTCTESIYSEEEE